jgi:hypothetical protein
VLDLPRCLREYGFAFAPEFGVFFARAFLRQMAPDLAKCKREHIAGEVEQYALSPKGEGMWPTSLRTQWHALVKALAAGAGVDSNLLELSYHVQDEKLLIAGRLKGEQAPRTYRPAFVFAHAERAAVFSDVVPFTHIHDVSLLCDVCVLRRFRSR